ncbi:transglycosylase SLT domain-containing protein [Pseudomonas sp. RIT-PI-AD]|uniref:transglycosylase SLT domain-containing protein n=1 Tax=Pseudomonas sp. RIT-PI-AD TaxID=3035294 RepID=UPI0021DA91E8|nr:transglycosylase SLT domain-containing protein [Pseudomonas sp. RIT-PI-AD]
MTGYRIPGPTCGTRSGSLDTGTLARTLSPAPGPVGSQGSGNGIDRTTPAERARLQEIRRLVSANNRSTLDNDLVICQIYMESRFDPMAKAPGSSAKGLMQLLKQAVQQVFKYRKQKELGHMPSDKVTQAAFDEGKELHQSALIYNEAVNIQLGTEYMQYLLDKKIGTEQAFGRYRDSGNGVYYRKIKTAADKLRRAPDSMQPLYEMVK